MSKSRFTPFYQPYGRDKRVYVSGPMTGVKDSNEAAFAEASAKLRSMGYAVCNPVETSALLGERTHAEYLRFDFERVLEADFIVALDGWNRSKGALAELLVAVRIGTKCWAWSTFADYNQITYEMVVQEMAELEGWTMV